MRIPTLISLTLAVLGLAHVLIVCMAEGWVHGYHHVLNDPGKVVFHLALLPAAVWVFANRLPRRVITTALSSHRVVAIGWAAFLIAVATLIVVKDAHESVCVRLATPFQLKATVRQGLARLYFELHTLHSEVRKAHEVSALPPQCSSGARPQSVDAATLKRLWSRNARNCYLTTLDESRIGNDADVRRGGDCKYWAVASWQNAWNALLSFLGTVFVLSVFWVISLHAFTRIRLDEETFTTLAVVALLVVPWMAFRMYSEWYLNFGDFDFSKYPLIYVAFIFTIGVAFVIIVLRAQRSVPKAWAALSALMSGIIAVVGYLKPEWMDAVASLIYVTDPFYVVLCYLIIVVVIYLAVYYLAGEERSQTLVNE